MPLGSQLFVFWQGLTLNLFIILSMSIGHLPEGNVDVHPLGKHCFHLGMHGKIWLKIGSTEWTEPESTAFRDLFPLFMALLFMSANYFLYKLQLFILYNIIFNLP